MMRPRVHLRNFAITALILTVLLSFAAQWSASPVDAQQPLVTLVVTNSPQQANPGGTTPPFNFTLTYNGTAPSRTFTLAVAGLPAGYLASFSTPVIVNAGSSVNIPVQITIPANAVPGTQINAQLSASSPAITTPVTEPAATATSVFTIVVAGTPPVPTPTPTAPPGPTPTPGPVCLDGFEPDNNPAAARVIDVNTTQRRTICPTGDEDWIFFGGIAGKVYTIDVPEMAAGLDLSLELFDPQLRSIAFNDDFFDRTPPNPFDLRPRIQSFTIPVDGRYYIRVRDTAGRGAVNYFYTISLQGEAAGPTPTLVPELCLDLFEPDGLPEQARLITSNELQEDRRLCPAGDADWVVFFGARGKRYFIFTDTRRYRGPNEVNLDTQAGADTIMYLVDRDGVSILDFNDDIPGLATLDSQIEFVPAVDGFYFVQIKNVGDIGNQFIRYDLTLQLCLPGQTDCGREGGTVPRATPVVAASPIAPTPTPAQVFIIDPSPTRTPTPRPSPTNTPGTAQGAVDAAAAGFADVAFQQMWQRSDLPISAQRTVRSWMWGPRALTVRDETYNQALSGARKVQYFDKARMEINNPMGDRSDPWFVTNGLLVQELISGQLQVGDNEFVARQPANVALAGDPGDPNAPTYASLQRLIGTRAPDLRGEEALTTLERDGRVGAYSGPRRAEARLVQYVPETGYNIPAVFWEFLNTQGEIYDQGRYTNGALVNWVAAMGYPVSEAYWVRVNVGGVARDVLVQAFQRRVLTYTPDNPPGWRVEMGNVGRHYYEWRYGETLP